MGLCDAVHGGRKSGRRRGPSGLVWRTRRGVDINERANSLESKKTGQQHLDCRIIGCCCPVRPSPRRARSARRRCVVWGSDCLCLGGGGGCRVGSSPRTISPDAVRSLRVSSLSVPTTFPLAVGQAAQPVGCCAVLERRATLWTRPLAFRALSYAEGSAGNVEAAGRETIKVDRLCGKARRR
jgi:hypothetical protein